MSAFLGPVHYWLYRKIQYQEQLNQKILKRISPQLNEIVDQELKRLKVQVEEISPESVIEVDTLEELSQLDSRYKTC